MLLKRSSKNAPRTLILSVGESREGFFQAFHEPAQALQAFACLCDPDRIFQPPLRPNRWTLAAARATCRAAERVFPIA